MAKSFHIIFLLTLFSSFAHAAETKIYKIKYLVERNDTLAKIYKRFVYPNSVITKNTPMTQRTFKSNPHVKDWKKLEPGTIIDLYIAYEYLDLSKFNKYVEDQKKIFEKIQHSGDENTLAGHLPQGLKASMFYMASYGKFSQKDPDIAEVEFYQNSPITLGTSFSYYPTESLWSFSASAYFSYLVATANNLNSENVSVPPEIGFTFYNEYRFEKYNFTGYFGVDYERFSTFNMGGIQQDRKILLDQNSTIYATAGMSKLIHLFKSPFFTKLSLSKSIISTITPNPDGISNTEGYDGYKILWYLNKKISERVYLHSLFKYHWMEGPSELTTMRLGLGFGYIFL